MRLQDNIMADRAAGHLLGAERADPGHALAGVLDLLAGGAHGGPVPSAAQSRCGVSGLGGVAGDGGD